jgi:hypothetical protein
VKYFGIDGRRAAFGRFPIEKKIFSKLACAIEMVFRENHNRKDFVICIGRDTRASGAIVFKALLTGFSSKTAVFDCEISKLQQLQKRRFLQRQTLALQLLLHIIQYVITE